MKDVVIAFIFAASATTSVFFLSRCQEVKLNVTCDANVAKCQELIEKVQRGKE